MDIRATGPLWAESTTRDPPFTGGFPLQNDTNMELLSFFCCTAEQAVEKTVKVLVIWNAVVVLK